MVNAAIMDDGNRPVNASWVVDLELPRADNWERYQDLAS